jgi:hypothetical protein
VVEVSAPLDDVVQEVSRGVVGVKPDPEVKDVVDMVRKRIQLEVPDTLQSRAGWTGYTVTDSWTQEYPEEREMVATLLVGLVALPSTASTY